MSIATDSGDDTDNERDPCWGPQFASVLEQPYQPAYQERYFQKGKLKAEIEAFKGIGIASLIGWSIAHQETQLIVLHVALHTAI